MSATTKSKQIDKKVSRIKLLVLNLRKETLDYANTAVTLACCTRKGIADFEKLCDEQFKEWELLYCHGITNKKKLKIVGISRTTYYRRKKWLKCPIFRSKCIKKLVF